MKVTVLGAAGGLGSAITSELITRGHEVTGATRRGREVAPGARPAAADLDDASAIARVTRGADVVVMAAQPAYGDWFGRWQPMLDRVIDATAAAGARLVLVDNLYMYGPVDGPISEATPERPNNPKMALRRDLSRQLFAAHEEGRVSATSGRLSDYYGPGGTNSLLFKMLIVPGLAGKAMQLVVDGDQPHTFAYLPDAARGFATLVEQPGADGRPWVLPSAAPITQRQAAEIVNSLLSRPVKVRTLPAWVFRLAAPFNTDAREGRHVAHQFDRPFVVNASAFLEAFGPIELTDHVSAFEATLRWARETGAVAA